MPGLWQGANYADGSGVSDIYDLDFKRRLFKQPTDDIPGRRAIDY